MKCSREAPDRAPWRFAGEVSNSRAFETRHLSQVTLDSADNAEFPPWQICNGVSQVTEGPSGQGYDTPLYGTFDGWSVGANVALERGTQ
jgi:hypothetical protein